MTDENIYPPKLERAYYKSGEMGYKFIVFEFKGGFSAAHSTGEKFPKPEFPIVILQELDGMNRPRSRFTGYLPIDGERKKLTFEDATDDPVIVNLSIEMEHAVNSGRFKDGQQVWPPPA